MLQQTQVGTVLGYYDRWLARFPDWRALAAASEAAVLHAWQGLGYYSRARNLRRAAKQVVAEFRGELPDDPAKIASLPGIGRYTAGAIASFAFDRAEPLVDANVARVLARLLDFREPIDSTAGAAVLWHAATELLPARRGRTHNSALMELGALVCLPRKPQCPSCPIREHCAARDPESLPVKRPRRETVEVVENCAWIEDHGRVLLEQQNGSRWRGMWKLPALVGAALSAPLFEAPYTFTHHRVILRVFAARPPRTLTPGQTWISLHEMSAIAFASAHRRAVEWLLSTPA